jgi:hypothetical protein
MQRTQGQQQQRAGGYKRKKTEKSELKAVIRGRFPSAFARDPTRDRAMPASLRLYVDEVSMRFYHIKNTRTVVSAETGERTEAEGATLADVMRGLTFWCNHVLATTSVRTVVLLTEKYRHVPAVKNIVRRARDEQHNSRAEKGGEAPYEWDGEAPILLKPGAAVGADAGGPWGDAPGGIVHENVIPSWASILCNQGAKHRAFDELQSILHEYVEVPEGKRVIIDGGDEDVPLMVYKGRSGERVVEPVEGFSNRIGEAEQRGFLYAEWFASPERLSQHSEALMKSDSLCLSPYSPSYEERLGTVLRDNAGDVLFSTTDTDALLYSMHYARRRMQDGLVMGADAGPVFLNNLFLADGPLRTEDAVIAAPADGEGSRGDGEDEGVGEEAYDRAWDSLSKRAGIPVRPSQPDRARPRQRSSLWVTDVNRLCLEVHRAVVGAGSSTPPATMDDALCGFVHACFFLGGDYLDGYHRVVGDTVVDAYMRTVAGGGGVGHALFSRDDGGDGLWKPNRAVVNGFLHAAMQMAYCKKRQFSTIHVDGEEAQPLGRNGKPTKSQPIVTVRLSAMSLVNLLTSKEDETPGDDGYMSRGDWGMRLRRWTWYINYVELRAAPSDFPYERHGYTRDANGEWDWA